MQMVRQFGLGAGAAQGLYTALAKIDRLSLDQKLKAVGSAVRETIGLSSNDPRFGNTNRISQFFDFGSTMFAAKNPNTGRAAALNQTIREFEAEEGIDAQTAAMQKLVEQTVELATLKGGISEEEQALIDVLKEQADVLLGIQAIEPTCTRGQSVPPQTSIREGLQHHDARKAILGAERRRRTGHHTNRIRLARDRRIEIRNNFPKIAAS